MNQKELPCGGRTLEGTEDEAEAVDHTPAQSENPPTNAEETRDAQPRRRRRKRRKPFVL